MVDVGAKLVTHRIAEAEARIRLPAKVAAALSAISVGLNLIVLVRQLRRGK